MLTDLLDFKDYTEKRLEEQKKRQNEYKVALRNWAHSKGFQEEALSRPTKIEEEDTVTSRFFVKVNNIHLYLYIGNTCVYFDDSYFYTGFSLEKLKKKLNKAIKKQIDKEVLLPPG